MNSGDWVRARLENDQVREFQYRELAGNILVGGDISLAVTEIESMEIYPVTVIAPPKMSGGDAIGATLGMIVAIGFVILMTGGLAAPVLVVP